MLYSISQATTYLGVSQPTLRRCDSTQRLIAQRTLGHHRRYTQDALDRIGGAVSTSFSPEISSNPLAPSAPRPYNYARVSSSHQQLEGNLDRQV